MTIIAAADGSALGNPGPAGWGWFIDDATWASGGWPRATNNIGELMAVLDLLRQTAGADDELVIWCDSTYVINSITKWMPGWKRKGWVKADGKPVLNLELMQDLDAAMAGRRVQFKWVKGHTGHELNEAADRLATAAALAYQQGRMPPAGPGFRSDRDARASGFVATGVTVGPDRAVRSAEEEVIELERALLSDAVRSSASALDALLHPQWSEIGSSGRHWTREEVLRIGPLDGPVALDLISAERLSDDLVLLLWRSTDDSGSHLRSSLWQRTPAGWQQRFHQGTPEPALPQSSERDTLMFDL
ncbi:MAG TPA: ribonuclease HI family protein [Tetrasphaera sp.]|uniref:Ribonuclease H n=1 Tax=Nostocoides vanveenii TaxID=330835 RepID=A0ABN2KW84_9MICO|nr:ribonuclease HI family protein [Tetrasphaera sp.]HNQ06520.1 ribonuclease HI family protein [Tetrasphaera sp.]